MPKIVAQVIPPRAFYTMKVPYGIWATPPASRGPASKQRDEATDENGLRAMLREERVHALDLRLIESHVGAVFVNEREAALLANPVARVVAEDCARGRGTDDPEDFEPAHRGERGRGDESCLTG